jgi:hypothetical protein
MSFLQLIYGSNLTDADVTFIPEILKSCEKNNSKRDISGMLIYANGRFLQALEGSEENVLETFDRISNDRRHYNLALIYKNAISNRDFSQWNMGFKELSETELNSLPHAAPFFITSIDNIDTYSCPSIARELLKTFANES